MKKRKFKKMAMGLGMSRNRANEFADYIARMSQYDKNTYNLSAATVAKIVELDRLSPNIPAFALF